jgi:valyl-tRNA synthetase
MRKDLDNYEFGLAKIKFEEFFWRDFCDNYLELVKVRLYKPELFENGEEKKKSGQYTLNKVLWDILRLVAPYLPFITEEIYQTIYKKTITTESIHICEYPSSDERKSIINRDTANTLKEMEEVSVVIEQVRKFKSEKQISI